MNAHVVVLPISIRTGKKKTFALNLNQYRNAHYFTLNKAKQLFQDEVMPAILLLPRMSGVKLTYTLFMGTNRAADLSNICSIVDKFFCDALVNGNRLPDDNLGLIDSIDYRFGGVDKGRPRIEVTLEPTEIIEDMTMRIHIVQEEIEQAISDFILNRISINDDQDLKIEIAATRGEQGFTASIEVFTREPEPDVMEQPVAAPKQRRNRAGSIAGQTTLPEVKTETKAELPEIQVEVTADPETSAAANDENVEDPNFQPPEFLSGKKSIFASN